MRSKSELLREWEVQIDKSRHYGDVHFGAMKVWYEDLDEQEKLTVDDLLLEKISCKGSESYYAFWTAFEIASKKTYSYYISILRRTLTDKDFSKVDPTYIKLLWQYPPSEETKDVLCHYFFDNDVSDELRFTALHALSKLFPGLALNCAVNFKTMYSSQSQFDFLFVYHNLIQNLGENFPKELYNVSSKLSQEELDRIFSNAPVLLSGIKEHTKKEKIASELEKLFNRKIERKVKL